MPIDLPDPDRARLNGSPLALVVCQLRFEEVPGTSEGRVGLRLQQDLAPGAYQAIDRIQSQDLSLQLGPGGVQPAVEAPKSGWRLTTGDRRWTVTVMPDSATLETPRYETWDDFRTRLAGLFDAVANVLEPATVSRLGLRYVDKIVRPEIQTPAGWQPYLSATLLGPILDEGFGPGVVAAQQQVDLDAGDGFRCALRHGTLRESEDALAYILDIDAYLDGLRPFDLDILKEQVDRLNTISLQVFQRATSRQLIETLATT